MDPLTGPARSWLFVPADRHDRFAKAAGSGADRVIVDLEDALPPGAKDDARRRLVDAVLPEGGGRPVYVRVNAVGTEWFEEDLRAAARLPVAGVLLPKAESAEHVACTVASLGAAQRVVPIVESAAGVWSVLEVARAPRVERLAFGGVDLALDAGMEDVGEVFAHARSRIVLASRVARLAPPVDSVTIAFDDDEQLRRDAERSRRFGFGGKMCVHPRQVAVIHGAFRPSAEDVEWAHLVLEAVEARADGAVFAFRGTMVDRPVVERARRIRAMAGDSD